MIRANASKLIEKVEDLRKDFDPPDYEDGKPGRIDLKLVHRLLEYVVNEPDLRGEGELVLQIATYLINHESLLEIVRIPIDGESETMLFIFFGNPAKADASFEAAIIEKFVLSGYESLDLAYDSIAYPARLLEVTSGLDNPELLGIFPEHLGHGKGEQQNHPNALAIYVIPRFVKRYREYVIPVLEKYTTDDSFVELKKHIASATQEELHEFLVLAAVVWLRAHEWSHVEKALEHPLHEFLNAYRSNQAAGLEELRADCLGIMEARSGLKDIVSAEKGELLASYIFSSRLLVYSLVDIDKRGIKPTFDTFGSHFLYKKLHLAGFIDVQGGKLKVRDDWAKGVQLVCDEIALIHSRAREYANYKTQLDMSKEDGIRKGLADKTKSEQDKARKRFGKFFGGYITVAVHDFVTQPIPGVDQKPLENGFPMIADFFIWFKAVIDARRKN